MFDHRADPPRQRDDCPHCAAARAAAAAAPPGQPVPPRGEHDAACLGCLARQIATSPAAWRALRGRTAVDLQRAIAVHWPGAAYEAGRQAVWDWCRTLRLTP